MDKLDVFRCDRLGLERHRFASLCLAGFWPDQEDTFSDHLLNALACPLPPDGVTSAIFPEGRSFRIHPNKLLLSSLTRSDLTTMFGEGFSAETGSLSDQSHGRACLQLYGADAVRTLQGCLPLDPEHALPEIGRFVQTRLQDANILICKTAPDRFEIHAPTSFAEAIEGALLRTANYIAM